MSLKDQLILWSAAKQAMAEADYPRVLSCFSKMDRSAMVSNNMGLLHMALGRHEKALRRFTDAMTRDNYLTIAYFQRGVSHFLLERYRPAGRDFKRAWLSLRGTDEINYEPLGLPFRLFASEILFNLGLSRIRLGRIDNGLDYLEKAKQLTMTEDHDVVDEVIERRGEGFTVFSIPPGVLYWPPDKKLTSITPKDYMGKAILIAATDPNDLTTDFIGPQLAAARRQGQIPTPHQRNLNRKSAAVLASRVTLRLAEGKNHPLPDDLDLDEIESDLRLSSDEIELECLSDVPRHVDAEVRLP